MASKNAARCGSPCTASFGEPHPPKDPAQTPRRHYSRTAFGLVACACRSGPDLAGMLPDACGPIGRPRAPGLHPGFRSETPPGAGRTHATPHRFTACPVKARYSFRTQARPHPPTDGPGPAPGAALPPEPGRPGMPSGEGAVSMRQGNGGGDKWFCHLVSGWCGPLLVERSTGVAVDHLVRELDNVEAGFFQPERQACV